jgi:hypothetical protein
VLNGKQSVDSDISSSVQLVAFRQENFPKMGYLSLRLEGQEID